MLKCLVRYLVDHVRLVQGISEQRRVKAPRVDRQRLRWMIACQEEHDVCISFSMASTCSKPEVGRRVRAA